MEAETVPDDPPRPPVPTLEGQRAVAPQVSEDADAPAQSDMQTGTDAAPVLQDRRRPKA